MAQMRLEGREAITYAMAYDLLLSKYQDPIEDARADLSIEEANKIMREDPKLVYLDVEAMEYRLSGEVEIESWSASESEALSEYNHAIEAHNESLNMDDYVFVERLSYQSQEELGDGITRYQWPNPSRNHGMLYLETRGA